MSATAQNVESSALRVGMVGNLAMGFAGVLASILSNSQALLVDGLFSLVGFFAAIIAVRVGRQSSARPDDLRPFGYAADEAVFTTFRALSLLGLVAFAFTNALAKIASYIGGTVPAPVKFEVIGVYTVVICLICVGLWANHLRCWKKTGEQSDILKLESRAAAFDGVITGTAGIGFGLVYLFQDGPLSVVAPIGDSIIVICLCCVASGTYWADFKSSLGELVGISAGNEIVKEVRISAEEHFSNEDIDIIDVVVMKTGRTHSVVVFIDPKKQVSGRDMDKLSMSLNKRLCSQFARVEVLIVVSEIGREVFRSSED